jgi:hypothetical protein
MKGGTLTEVKLRPSRHLVRPRCGLAPGSQLSGETPLTSFELAMLAIAGKSGLACVVSELWAKE